MKKNSLHEKYMKIAITLARKARGNTSPNPLVGAVLVKNGKIIASSYHKKAGSIHAEASVIRKAGKKARGATLYSTLEACTHYGKTPPCTDAIIESGIKKAFFAMRDPNPINYSLGIAKLREGGIEVKCGVLEKEARDLNRPFIKFIEKHLPYVTIKIAESLDGKIGDTSGRSRWISSKSSRKFVHKMRLENDAVMIGVNTLLKDDPLLTSRLNRGKKRKSSLKIVLDTNLKTPLNSRILKDNRKDVLIVGGRGASLRKKALLEKKGTRVLLLPKKERRVDLRSLMRYLAKMNIMSVLSEGGGEISASLLKDKLVDEALFFISPRIIGGRTAPTSCDGGKSNIRKSIKLRDKKVKQIGEDILVRGII